VVQKDFETRAKNPRFIAVVSTSHQPHLVASIEYTISNQDIMSKAIKLIGTGRFQVLGLPAEKDAEALLPMTKKGTSSGMYLCALLYYQPAPLQRMQIYD
jgi:hypothetical protein